jgi:negative regulator of flagellin synthesis FlgM
MKGVSGNPALDAYQRMAVAPVSQAKAPDQSAVASGGDKSSEAAQVSISSHAKELAGRSSEVDPQKVEALKAQVDNGSFQVNAAAVAEKLVQALG